MFLLNLARGQHSPHHTMALRNAQGWVKIDGNYIIALFAQYYPFPMLRDRENTDAATSIGPNHIRSIDSVWDQLTSQKTIKVLLCTNIKIRVVGVININNYDIVGHPQGYRHSGK